MSAVSDLRAKLPELRAEHATLGKLIALLEEGGDTGEEGGETPPPGAGSNRNAGRSGGVVGPDEFVGMSAAKAIRAFLAITGKGKPQGPREMAHALMAGGRGDANFEAAYANVTSALKRLNKNHEIKQVRRGQWGLASWYNGTAKTED